MSETHIVDTEDTLRIHVDGAVLVIPAAAIVDLVLWKQGLPICGEIGPDSVITWKW